MLQQQLSVEATLPKTIWTGDAREFGLIKNTVRKFFPRRCFNVYI